MISIGLAGWGDHDRLYLSREAVKNKLKAYSEWFGAVEVDSSFYAIQPLRNMEKWAAETPPDFRFLVKAYQGMTGHTRGRIPFDSERRMFELFCESLQPLMAADKLEAVLFQYPPWFDCTKENVQQLRQAKAYMGNVPCVLEFRHQSWFEPEMKSRTLSFMEAEGWILSVCDEPQAGLGCIPIVEAATDQRLTLVRFHGRNVQGWHNSGQANWREVRYLYRYNDAELLEWADRLNRLQLLSDKVLVIFNNNSGGDAADNAKRLMQLLDLVPPRGSFETKPSPDSEPPEQLEWF